MAFIEASRGEIFIKAIIAGVAGSGKSYTAIKIASCLAAWSEGIQLEGEPFFPPELSKIVAVIESENRSREYAGGRPFFYSVEELTEYGPDHWIRALEDARRLGFRAVVLDSLSDEWRGRGGCLELVESKGGAFNAWKEVKRAHWALVEAIQNFPGHVIVTVRSKAGIEIHEDPNSRRKVPVKTPPTPIQEEEFPYRLSHYWEMFQDDQKKRAVLRVDKSVAPNIPIGSIYEAPGVNFSKELFAFCSEENGKPSLYKRYRDGIRSAAAESMVLAVGQDIKNNLGSLTIREVGTLREILQAKLAELNRAADREKK